MHTSPLALTVVALCGLACMAFPMVCRVIAARRIVHYKATNPNPSWPEQYQQDMDKGKQDYAVWSPNASQNEMLKALDDYLNGRPVQW